MTEQERIELAQYIRDLDMLKQPTQKMRNWSRDLCISDRGTREEVMERLSREVFLKRYDEEKGA